MTSNSTSASRFSLPPPPETHKAHRRRSSACPVLSQQDVLQSSTSLEKPTNHDAATSSDTSSPSQSKPRSSLQVLNSPPHAKALSLDLAQQVASATVPNPTPHRLSPIANAVPSADSSHPPNSSPRSNHTPSSASPPQVPIGERLDLPIAASVGTVTHINRPAKPSPPTTPPPPLPFAAPVSEKRLDKPIGVQEDALSVMLQGALFVKYGRHGT